ncbi:MAG TPA: M36 family metallopeptidase [Kofleriaceae bacterium]|nr:M36 family metallopeptidase [Kofleriaceae bacterium]
MQRGAAWSVDARSTRQNMSRFMVRHHNVVVLLATSALSLGACAVDPADDAAGGAAAREGALRALEREAGAPIAVEVGEGGAMRVLAMTPQFHVPGRHADPAEAAMRFLADHHDAFGLGDDEAASFRVTRVDVDPRSAVRHVTLQRFVDGDAVFQGAVTVHMDDANRVFRALGDPAYRSALPLNQRVLTPGEAAVAAGRALGLGDLAVAAVAGEGERAVFRSTRTLDPIEVVRRVFEVARDDSRFAYQVTMAWLDEQRQMQYQLVLVDAESGALLASYDLVDTFTGRVFTASPGADPQTDGRVVVSFDGDPVASPSGWVGAARKTAGNNAVAATDLDGNNLVGATEVQPAADGNDAFDFAFSPTADAAGFKEAAVANAFYLVNDWHDRAYALGFTESAGNFQASNFGKGGAQNDDVQIDAQDGAGINNATFATPPDGSKPRMQLFRFTLKNGATGAAQDGDFDPTVIYHEHTHGLSNRLVGGGTTGCLGGIQSGGMGEGWSDFLAASFLEDPVIGAYVTGNAEAGIRRASMADSPFTYANIKDRSMTEKHDAGEVWAATLWDLRTILGKATTEPLVVSGMKLTPCIPTMLQARDAIVQADANLNAGANRCAIFAAFAGRLMGSDAVSHSDNSTNDIVTSDAVPADCATAPPPSRTRTFTSTHVPRSIPDNDPAGVATGINVKRPGLVLQKVLVSVDITHTYRGDLTIQLIAPSGEIATLADRTGGSADNFIVADLDVTSSFTAGSSASGPWKLFVRDTGIQDTGTINAFSITITATN